jgi:membrane-bound lytic murein transglycosylase
VVQLLLDYPGIPVDLGNLVYLEDLVDQYFLEVQ